MHGGMDFKPPGKDKTMSIQPEGEEIRRAVKWISEEKTYEQVKPIKELIEAACLKFDLSPLETNFLFQFYKEDKP